MHLPVELCLLLSLVAATPLFSLPTLPNKVHTVPLIRNQNHALHKRSAIDLLEYTQREAEKLKYKYVKREQDDRPLAKRQLETVEVLYNLNRDSEYFGTISVGTPPKSYAVTIDTGSSDLWFAETGCSSCEVGTSAYLEAQSSSANITTEPFSITYGTGKATGVIGFDNVTFAGFYAAKQAFGLCDSVTSSLTPGPVSGLLGLGFERLASTNSPPFWESANVTEMGFALSRYIHNVGASEVEPGGYMTLGGVNESLIQGNITYHDVTEESYWLIESNGFIVSGEKVPKTASSRVAIDTGTSLLGGPKAGVAAVFDRIPGAQLSSNYNGYYEYPCNASFNISMAFGGVAYPINLNDFNLGYVDSAGSTLDNGRLFVLNQSNPEWLVGGTLLKNYYTSFRTSPPAVGFANLRGSSVQLFQTSSASMTSIFPFSILVTLAALALTLT